MKHQLIRMAYIFALMLTAAATVAAQNFRARLVGTVTDQTDTAIPGATVTAVNVGTNQSFTVVTNEQGAFVIANHRRQSRN